MSVQPVLLNSSNLSVAWGRAMQMLFDRPNSQSGPIVVSVEAGESDTELPHEDPTIRAAVDDALERHSKVPVRVSALTIFPYEMWVRRNRPSCAEFSAVCVEQLLPRMRCRDQRNRLGTYFERMMAFTGRRRNGETNTVNQLQFVVDLMNNASRRPRQSALQLACFDPAKDHSRQTRRGFPCLQQVSVTYEGHDGIAINAFYPTQFLFDRGYGNYLGLCQLGAFIAHETGTRLVRMTSFVGRPELGNIRKRDITGLIAAMRPRLNDGTAGTVS